MYHFGRIRRTDWLPVGGPGEPEEQEVRSAASRQSSDGNEDSDENEAMTGDGGVSAALRAVRQGFVPGEESSGQEEHEPADFSSDTDAGFAEAHASASDTSSSVGQEPHSSTSEDEECAQDSRWGAEEPRFLYHQVAELAEEADDAAGLMATGVRAFFYIVQFLFYIYIYVYILV